MKLLVLLLLTVLLAATPGMPAAAVCPAPLRPQTRMFQKLPLDDVLVTRPVQSEASAPSDLDCGRRCAGREGCAMFTFTASSTDNDQAGQCRLYGQQQANATEGQQNSPGARSYALYDVEKPCDNGYSRVCGRCLRPVMFTKTYVQARDHCQTLDKGHLMGLKTLEDLDCAMCLMKAQGLTSSFWIWVGADDLNKEGSYVWWDGNPLPVGSPLWAPGQPNNHSPWEDCMAALTSDRGLHDDICSYSKYFLCERDL